MAFEGFAECYCKVHIERQCVCDCADCPNHPSLHPLMLLSSIILIGWLGLAHTQWNYPHCSVTYPHVCAPSFSHRFSGQWWRSTFWKSLVWSPEKRTRGRDRPGGGLDPSPPSALHQAVWINMRSFFLPPRQILMVRLEVQMESLDIHLCKRFDSHTLLNTGPECVFTTHIGTPGKNV